MKIVFHLENVSKYLEKHNGRCVLVTTWPKEMRVECYYQNGTLDHCKYYNQEELKPYPLEKMSHMGVPMTLPPQEKVMVSGIIKDRLFMADHLQEGEESILDARDKPTDKVFEKLKSLGFKVLPSIKLSKGDILLEKILLMETFANKEEAMVLLQHSFNDKIGLCVVVDHTVIKNYIDWSWCGNLETYTVP